jgi:hypothetical protein
MDRAPQFRAAECTRPRHPFPRSCTLAFRQLFPKGFDAPKQVLPLHAHGLRHPLDPAIKDR